MHSRLWLPWPAWRASAQVAPQLDAGEERTDRVVRVVDGDTVELEQAGNSRLIGVDTPEVFGGAEYFGPQASTYTKRLLAKGSTVRIALDNEPRDRYGRALVYLELPDGRLLNRALIEQGYACTLAIAPNTDRASEYARTERRARKRQVGLWGACPGR